MLWNLQMELQYTNSVHNQILNRMKLRAFSSNRIEGGFPFKVPRTPIKWTPDYPTSDPLYKSVFVSIHIVPFHIRLLNRLDVVLA